MADNAESRVHPATPRKRQQARAEGHIPQSRDLSSVIMLLVVITALGLLGPSLVDYLATTTSEQLSGPVITRIDGAWLAAQWHDQIWALARVTLPLLAIALVVPIIIHLVQTRMLFRLASTTPDWSRIAPSRGVRRVMSGDSFFQSGMGILKAVAIAGVVSLGLYARRADIVNMTTMTVDEMAHTLVDVLLGILLQAAGMLLAIAVVDYFYQRWKYERELMMTTEELREEMREDRQHPEIAAGRRILRDNMVRPS